MEYCLFKFLFFPPTEKIGGGRGRVTKDGSFFDLAVALIKAAITYSIMEKHNSSI